MPQNAYTEGFWSAKTKVGKHEVAHYQLALTCLPQSNDFRAVVNSNGLGSSNNYAKALAFLTTYSGQPW